MTGEGGQEQGRVIDDWMTFELVQAPWLVRAILTPGDPPSALRKLPKILFNNLHMLARLPAGGRLRVTAPGRAFTTPVDLRNRQIIDTAKAFRDVGCYEAEVSLLLDRLLAGAAVFHDVGTNFGYHAIRAAMNPAFEGVVHAFEMSPRTFRDFQGLVEGAGLADRIVGHGLGLSDVTGAQPFRQNQHSGRSMVVASGPRQATARLDDLDLPPPDVMKIDVEGHEAAVLAGAARTLASARPAIIFESWCAGETDLAPFRLLEPLGYRFFAPQVREGRPVLHGITAEQRLGAGNRLNILAITERHESIFHPLIPAEAGTQAFSEQPVSQRAARKTPGSPLPRG